MSLWWLLLIVPACLLAGAIGLIALAWFMRDTFPTIFVPSDW